MKLSRVATITTATVSSVASFYVLTRSGLAGTLVGAAVAATVYNLASQGLTHGIDAGKHWLARRRDPDGVKAATPKQDETVTTEHGGAATPPEPETDSVHRPGLVARWAPAALGLVAVGLSISALVNPDPEPRVITERVVAQPVIQEHIVVQERTVTVTVPAASASPTTGGGAGTPSSTQAGDSAHTSTTETPGSASSTTEPVAPPAATPPTTAPATEVSAEGTAAKASN